MSSKFQIYKFHFQSGFHFDSAGYAYESSNWMIHSDTLFGALCHSYLLLYGKTALEGFLNKGQPDIQFSSCFPFKGSTYYFPVPKKARDFQQLDDFRAAKKLRKKKLMPLDVFQQDLMGQLAMKDWAKQSKTLLPYHEVERPRVIVDRVDNKGQIFHFAEVHYEDTAGLFFMIKVGDQWKQKVEAAFRLLGEEGIGADSTVGKGQFTLEKSELELTLPTETSQYVLLSLYNPSIEELDNLSVKNSYYDYLVRNGWITAGGMNLRRQSIRMLQEGSIISTKNGQTPQGRVATVLTDEHGLGHPVYRYGKALTLPIVA